MSLRKKTTEFVLPALAVFLGIGPWTPIRAQDLDDAKARRVQAAYLFNFARFVQWPEDVFKGKNAAFVIGVLGDDPFGRILDDTVRSKKVAGRAVSVRRIRWQRDTTRAAVKGCHMLYISGSEQHRLGEIIAALHNRPVLMVSDMDDFPREGGMIGFVLDQGRIVFEINRSALQRARLKASSKLLKLARLVDDQKRDVARARGGHQTP